jgi:hypothetical protein
VEFRLHQQAQLKRELSSFAMAVIHLDKAQSSQVDRLQNSLTLPEKLSFFEV